jgi:hypothetical protein
MFNNYAIVQGVDHVVPVDMYVPGCPPRPEMLMDGDPQAARQDQAEQLVERPRPGESMEDFKRRTGWTGPDEAVVPGDAATQPQAKEGGREHTTGFARGTGHTTPAGWGTDASPGGGNR